MPLPASWCTLRCDGAYVEGGRVGMYLSQLVALANTLDPPPTPLPPILTHAEGSADFVFDVEQS